MSRYGIAEWYGRDFLTLAPAERQVLAATAMGEGDVPQCPFRSITCNKRGGVCSLQSYTEATGSIAETDGHRVIVCPNRFEQDSLLVRWLADIVGFRPEELQLAREIPFMQSVVTKRPAGKIDLVIAADRHELRWFGLEIQAVYFSGDGMSIEFEALRKATGVLPPYPLGKRRPDWRSSSAKRLMPQLQVKGPTLRRWHSKIAVAVDTPFFESLGGPSKTPEHDLDAGDIIWLVPELRDGTLVRGHWEVLTLEASCEKLLAARAISRRDFERVLRGKLRSVQGSHDIQDAVTPHTGCHGIHSRGPVLSQ